MDLIKLYSDEYSVDAINHELEIERKTVAQIILETQKLVLPHREQKIKHNAILHTLNNKVILESIAPTKKTVEDIDDIIILEFRRFKELGNIYSFLIHSTNKKGKKHRYSVLDRFLSYAKMKLISYGGLSSENLNYYLLELILKFNLGDTNFYNFVIKKLHFSRVVETIQSL